MTEVQLYLTLLIVAVLVLLALCFVLYLCGRKKPEPAPFPVVKLTPGEADLVFRKGLANRLEAEQARIRAEAEAFNKKVDEYISLCHKGFGILGKRHNMPRGYVLQVSYIDGEYYLYPIHKEEDRNKD